MYVIDTSALLDGWARHYPPDVFPSLWSLIEEMIKVGELLSPGEVLVELRGDFAEFLGRRFGGRLGVGLVVGLLSLGIAPEQHRRVHRREALDVDEERPHGRAPADDPLSGARRRAQWAFSPAALPPAARVEQLRLTLKFLMRHIHGSREWKEEQHASGPGLVAPALAFPISQPWSSSGNSSGRPPGGTLGSRVVPT